MVTRGTLSGYLALVLALVTDQVTKTAVLNQAEGRGWTVEVTEFFNFVLVYNRGVSFGMFGESRLPYQDLLLAGLAAVVALVLISWLKRDLGDRLSVAYGLIAGGALGNAIDRVRLGAVVDFLDFHWEGLHWPAFNVADSAIFIGVVLVIVDALFGSDEGSKKKADAKSR